MENNDDLAIKLANIIKVRMKELTPIIRKSSLILERQNNESLDQAAKRVVEERDMYKFACLNLLTRIHRDGGHHVERYGFKKSLEDADQIIVKLNQLIDDLSVDNLLKEF